MVAEEEGFDFPQYEGGTRWHTLVCYSEKVASRQFTFSPHKRWLSAIPNSVDFCSICSTTGQPNFSRGKSSRASF